MTPELEALQIRVGNGIEWLVQHDPSGAFHFWFEAGLTPLSPMPAHDGADDDTRERWRAYYNARVIYERLEAELMALEAKEG